MERVTVNSVSVHSVYPLLRKQSFWTAASSKGLMILFSSSICTPLSHTRLKRERKCVTTQIGQDTSTRLLSCQCLLDTSSVSSRSAVIFALLFLTGVVNKLILHDFNVRNRCNDLRNMLCNDLIPFLSESRLLLKRIRTYDFPLLLCECWEFLFHSLIVIVQKINLLRWNSHFPDGADYS